MTPSSTTPDDATVRMDVLAAAELIAAYARAGLPLVAWLVRPDATGVAMNGQVLPPADAADTEATTRTVVGAYAPHLGEPRDDVPDTLYVAAVVDGVDVAVWGRLSACDGEEGDG